MSTVSFLQTDQSNLLAKRFAYLASSYFDRPDDAKAPAAKIPLENLFRLLQMYRYGAFSDEPRCGVLDLREFDELAPVMAPDELWHQKIEEALAQALAGAFGGTPKDQAIQEIQSALAWLATDADAPSVEVRARSKDFLDRFIATLD